MRLLNTATYELETVVRDIPKYAILSHRWINEDEGGEITFATLNLVGVRNPAGPQGRSWSKIENACRRAQEDDLHHIWIDTVCINKNDAEELGRSLNSMFDWYSRAEVCYVYLQDVTRTLQRVGTRQYSEWFERGWTLQELLAPRKAVFFDMTWQKMGTRKDLANDIARASKIDAEYLEPPGSFRAASVATKMSWMAGRSTKYIEDITFSMLGIFNVKLAFIPAEGANAFFRLQSELLKSGAFDESLFAWTVPADKHLKCYEVRNNGQVLRECRWSPQDDRWGLLAPSPDCFVSITRIDVDPKAVVPRIGGGFQERSLGVTLDVPISFVASKWTGQPKDDVLFPLNCWTWNEQVREKTNVVLRLKRPRKATTWMREGCSTLGPSASGWGSKKDWKVKDNRVAGIDQQLAGSITVHQPRFELA